MELGTILARIVDELPWSEIDHGRHRASEVAGVAVGKDESIEPVDSACSQITAKDALVIAGWAGIEKPVAIIGADVDRGTSSEVEHVDLEIRACRPVRAFNIEMATRHLR